MYSPQQDGGEFFPLPSKADDTVGHEEFLVCVSFGRAYPKVFSCCRVGELFFAARTIKSDERRATPRTAWLEAPATFASPIPSSVGMDIVTVLILYGS